MRGTVRPFLETYCTGCHGKEKKKGKLDLSAYQSPADVAQDYRRWETVVDRLRSGEMPPEEARKHPTPEMRQKVIAWAQTVRRQEAQKNAGDPGVVLARRLSNAEYDYSVRDLTGIDFRLAREFPVDPANEAGFDNSGESLAMSPVLLKKQLEAARRIAECVVLKPDGFDFAPHPMVTEPDRDKYCVQRIVEFYQRQPTNYADYFFAAWRYRGRVALREPGAALDEFAASMGLSSRYLTPIYAVLTMAEPEFGPFAVLRAMWREMPKAAPDAVSAARAGASRMSDVVALLREQVKPGVTNLRVRGIAPGSQPFVLWKARKMAKGRMRYSGTWQAPTNEAALEKLGVSTWLKHPALAIPSEATRSRYDEEWVRFCRLFPDAFYVSERGLSFDGAEKHEGKGRLLSAGFHLMTGYFRDDAPLEELLLNEAEARELRQLWAELDFITLAPIRQYKDFIFFERAEPPRFMFGAEFDFARSEDKDAAAQGKIRRLAEAYLAKALTNGATGDAVVALEDYFRNIAAEINHVEGRRAEAEPSHLKALLDFAGRAYRRSLLEEERADLLAFYRTQREKEGLSHEDAIRESLVGVLMSPHFNYRAQPPPSGRGVQLLPDVALASRLSYFLWSSLPDLALLSYARSGELHEPEQILAQTRRMLRDERARALAVEFGGNWLDFRRFEEHNSVDRQRFPSFDNNLRAAMFEEPVRFFMNIVREDRSVLEFLYGNYTFVNDALATHYGMLPRDKGAGSEAWWRVEEAGQFGRGGLLPMSVFLTQNSPGLRTSPVKRGYWVVRRLLGEVIPPPPATVPELPADEAKLGELTLSETIARHRADKACRGCHERFDAFGLVFEGYGPIGERREKDLANHPVQVKATFPGGSERVGLQGLRDYVRAMRQDDFLDNLCRKLLAFALGRTLVLTDDPLIEELRRRLAADGYRFSTLVEGIVTSRQFRFARGQEDVAAK